MNERARIYERERMDERMDERATIHQMREWMREREYIRQGG